MRHLHRQESMPALSRPRGMGGAGQPIQLGEGLRARGAAPGYGLGELRATRAPPALDFDEDQRQQATLRTQALRTQEGTDSRLPRFQVRRERRSGGRPGPKLLVRLIVSSASWGTWTQTLRNSEAPQIQRLRRSLLKPECQRCGVAVDGYSAGANWSDPSFGDVAATAADAAPACGPSGPAPPRSPAPASAGAAGGGRWPRCCARAASRPRACAATSPP